MKLSVITPTFNEARNIGHLINEVEAALQGNDYEIIVADDNSSDGTGEIVEGIAERNPAVRLLRRVAQPGLSAAVVDGFSLAQGDVVACIDADLQHDPRILPLMLSEIRDGADLVVGSRHTSGGGTANWSAIRQLQSWIATKLEQWLLGVPLADPMSGYFMLRRRDFLRVRDRLNPEGFKILLEITAHLRPQRIREVPYIFGPRKTGKSKLSGRVALAYLRQLWRLSSLTQRS